MPGIALALGVRAANALAVATHDGYEQRTYGDDLHGILLGAPGYPAYPILTVEDHWGAAILEGGIYAASERDVRDAVASLGRRFGAGDVAGARDASEVWAAQQDGDFVLAFVARDGSRALIVNDRLGRLPLFSSSRDGCAAVARELKAVREACGAGDVDRIALAQTLLFSFPLGNRTLHQHIKRVPEASSVVVDRDGTVDIRPYYQWNFETLAGEGAGGATDAASLAELFVRRCAAQLAWAGARPIVLGLSGGLDSRAVAAALSRAGARYSCVTFASRRKKAAEETDTSRQIAEALGVEWEEYPLEPPSWHDARRMAQLRDGASNVALSFLFEYFAKLVEAKGPRVVHFTGDGGDRALPDLRAEIPIRSRDDFLAYRLANALWRLDDVARLVSLSAAEIAGSLRAHFDSYPERDPAFLNVRFMIADWAMRRLFAGEDRNRAFVWNLTPFYCQSFFDAAMRAPLAVKRHYRLYADFLAALDRRVTGIAKSNWGYAVTSPLVRWQALRDALTSSIALRLKAGMRSETSRRTLQYGTRMHDPEFAELAQSHRSEAFAPDALRALTERGLDKLQFHMLATVLLYVDDVWGAARVLRDA